eukprot:Clim_evm6s183 gene=Clim_evmTU6s183
MAAVEDPVPTGLPEEGAETAAPAEKPKAGRPRVRKPKAEGSTPASLLNHEGPDADKPAGSEKKKTPAPNTAAAVLEARHNLMSRRLKELYYQEDALIAELNEYKIKVTHLLKERSSLMDKLLEYEEVPTTESEKARSLLREEDERLMVQGRAATDLQEEEIKTQNTRHDPSSGMTSKAQSLSKRLTKRAKSAAADAKKEMKAMNAQAKAAAAAAAAAGLVNAADSAAVGNTIEDTDPSPTKKKRAPVGINDVQPENVRSAKPGKPRKGFCLADGCMNQKKSGIQYCHPHCPLDERSGYIWCTYKDPVTGKEVCDVPVRKKLKSALCPEHRPTGIGGHPTDGSKGKVRGMKTEDDEDANEDDEEDEEEITPTRKTNTPRKKHTKSSSKSRTSGVASVTADGMNNDEDEEDEDVDITGTDEPSHKRRKVGGMPIMNANFTADGSLASDEPSADAMAAAAAAAAIADMRNMQHLNAVDAAAAAAASAASVGAKKRKKSTS